MRFFFLPIFITILFLWSSCTTSVIKVEGGKIAGTLEEGLQVYKGVLLLPRLWEICYGVPLNPLKHGKVLSEDQLPGNRLPAVAHRNEVCSR